MTKPRIAALALGTLLTASLAAFAQTPAPEPVVTKAEAAKKSAADKKEEARRIAEKKAADKKAAAAKNATATKTAAKKPAPTKSAAAPKPSDQKVPVIKTYTTGPMVLRDKDGNIIPTDPNAYNVDSAVKR